MTQLISHIHTAFPFTQSSAVTPKVKSHKETELTLFYSRPTPSTKRRLPLSVMTQNEIFLCLPGCPELPQISSTSATSIQLFQCSEEFCFGHFFANTEVSESSSSFTQVMLFSFPKCWHHQTVSCCTPPQHSVLTSTPVHKHLHCLPDNPKSTSQTLAGITAQ